MKVKNKNNLYNLYYKLFKNVIEMLFDLKKKLGTLIFSLNACFIFQVFDQKLVFRLKIFFFFELTKHLALI